MIKESARRRILKHLGSGSRTNDGWNPDIIRGILDNLDGIELNGEQIEDWRDLVFYASLSTGARMSLIMGKNRKRINLISRYLIYEELCRMQWTREEVGRLFNCDQSAVTHGLRKLGDDISNGFEEVIEMRRRFLTLIGKN